MNFEITGKKITTTLPQKKPINPPKKVQKIVSSSIVQRKSIVRSSIKKVQQKKTESLKIKENKQQKIIEVLKPVEIKQQQIRLQQPPNLLVLQQKRQQPKPSQPIKVYEILVRYNHYKDKFPVQNDILKYQVIQDKYGFALVFKGNYLPKLRFYRNYKEFIQPLTLGNTALQYTWVVEQGKQYEITIQQDEEQQNKYEKKVYIAPKQQQKCCLKKNKRVEQLTKQMRNMSVEQLGSQKHKQLLEQRALQQVLYS